MRILMVSPSYYPIVGGTETVVQNITTELNDGGVHTDVMTFNMADKWKPVWKYEEVTGKFKIFRLPALNPLTHANPLSIGLNVHVIPDPNYRRIFNDYEIIHFHDDADLSFSLFAQGIEKPKVFHCHTLNDTFGYYKKNILSKTLLKKAADVYICVAESTRNLLLGLGVPRSKTKVVYNGVDTKRYSPLKEERYTNSILFVGRYEMRKGLHVLLESLYHIKTPLEVIIIGPVTGSKYSKFILQLIKKVNTETRHNVLQTGFVPEDEMIRWYQKTTIFLCPSLLDVFPTVIPQALACGAPVIASDVGGIPEIVENDVNGLLVPPGHPGMLADAIERLLENKSLREEYGMNGRRTVERRFSLGSITGELLDIYAELTR